MIKNFANCYCNKNFVLKVLVKRLPQKDSRRSNVTLYVTLCFLIKNKKEPTANIYKHVTK